MKKKLLALFATIIIALPIFTMVAHASDIQPRWSLIDTATIICSLNSDSYAVSITAVDDVYRMDIDAVLYEKGLLSSYKEVSRISKTVFSSYHSAAKDYDFSSLKDYKIILNVKAYTQSGQTETITLTEEY